MYVRKVKRKVYKKKRTSKAISSVNKRVIRSVVKNTVKNLVEKKSCNQDPQDYTFNASNATMSPAVHLDGALDLSQGNTDGTRIGNQINVTKAVLNFVITRSTIGAFKPGIISIFIGYVRNNRRDPPSSANLLEIYQDGSTSTDADGTLLSTLRNVNTDRFVIFKKMDFKIGFADNGGNHANNDFPLMVRKKISLKPLLGKITYNDANTSNHDKQLFMWATYTNYDSVLTTSTNVILKYYLDIEYIDL